MLYKIISIASLLTSASCSLPLYPTPYSAYSPYTYPYVYPPAYSGYPLPAAYSALPVKAATSVGPAVFPAPVVKTAVPAAYSAAPAAFPAIPAATPLIKAAIPAAPLVKSPIVATAPVATPIVAAAKIDYADVYPQYQYAYNIHDSLTGDSKAQVESRDGDIVKGRYSLIEADGSRRTVNYYADPLNGFNAVVQKELPVVAAPIVKTEPAIVSV